MDEKRYEQWANKLVRRAFWANPPEWLKPGTNLHETFNTMASIIATDLELCYLHGYQDGVKQEIENRDE